MSKLKIELNHDAVEQLLKSQAMKNMLHSRADAIASRMGGKAKSYISRTRAAAKVVGDDGKNKLLKAVRK